MQEVETVIRAFELPLQRIECVDGRDGWALLRECWEEATYLANWGVQQLLRADIARSPEMEKLPRRPAINGEKLKGLYGLASESLGLKTGWWAGACISASTIIRAVENKYDQERLEVVWRRSKAPCTYRYPYPWPVHAQGWKGAGFDDEGRPWILCSLPGGLAKITLRGGVGKDQAQFARQLALFREVVEGQRPRKQLVIRQQGSSNGCHRPTLEDGGRPCRVMVKMVAEVAVRERPGNRTMTLLTAPECFWVAELDGRRAWIANQDHALRLTARLAEHERHLIRLQRMSEDGKFEDRTCGHVKRQQTRLDALCQKDRRRLDSLTHELAARVTAFAVRQKVGEVVYDDTCTEFAPRFPWFALRSKLRDKLTVAGIALVESTNGE